MANMLLKTVERFLLACDLFDHEKVFRSKSRMQSAENLQN